MTNIIMPVIWATLSSFAFCGIFNVKEPKIVVVSSLGGGLGWFVYLLFVPMQNVVMQNLIAAVAVAFFSEVMSRVMKAPATIFLVIGILPMVPGGGIYYTMEYCIQGNHDMFIAKGVETVAVAGAIAVGVSLASALFRFYTYSRNQRLKRGSM